MASDDLKAHINSPHDFYALLDISPAAQETEIRRAYRKTALKYHPDKVGPSNTVALEKFHLLQIAYDVLSDTAIRELYDNARRAKEAKKERESQMSVRRQEMVRDLERREKEAAKRKRGEMEDAGAAQTELERIREDTKRRRVELQEKRRREAEERWEILYGDGEKEDNAIEPSAPLPRRNDRTPPAETPNESVDVDERSVKVRFPVRSTTDGDGDGDLDDSRIKTIFSRFGDIETVVIVPKTPKELKKHKKQYNTALVVFQTIDGARAAVNDFATISASNHPGKLGLFKEVKWLNGKGEEPVPASRLQENGSASAITMFPSFLDPETIQRMKNADEKRRKAREESENGM